MNPTYGEYCDEMMRVALDTTDILAACLDVTDVLSTLNAFVAWIAKGRGKGSQEGEKESGDRKSVV